MININDFIYKGKTLKNIDYSIINGILLNYSTLEIAFALGLSYDLVRVRLKRLCNKIDENKLKTYIKCQKMKM